MVLAPEMFFNVIRVLFTVPMNVLLVYFDILLPNYLFHSMFSLLWLIRQTQRTQQHSSGFIGVWRDINLEATRK
jgi:hypothetical protein